MRTTIELWQAEWCPASRRVRQRLTELGVSYLVRQVPVAREDRQELAAATGEQSIPVLVAGVEVVAGEQAIIEYLNGQFAEPAEAQRHSAKAAAARRKELEQECRKLAADTQ